MPQQKPTKPIRSTFTSKLTDLHDVYRGPTNHWSIMRTEGDAFVVQVHQKEREAKGQSREPLPPPPGCTVAPYVWSREQALQMQGHVNFYDKVLEGLGGELPGDLSKDQHKNYNRGFINWPANHFRTHAKQGNQYWMVTDLTMRLSARPKMKRNELPI